MKIGSKKAFSLIELLITITLAGILSTLLLNLLVSGLKMYKKNSHTVKLQNNIALAMREFEYSTRAASELVSLNNKNMEFLRYYDIEKDSAPTKVRFFFNQNNEFFVGKTEPEFSESGVIWPSEKEVTTLLIKDVVSANSQFKYYDQSNTEITTIVNDDESGDATNQQLLFDIKLIELSMSLNDDFNGNNSTVTGSTRVNLRNLKTNI